MVQLIIQHQSNTTTCIINMAHLLSHNVKAFREFIKKNQFKSVLLHLFTCINKLYTPESCCDDQHEIAKKTHSKKTHLMPTI